MKIVAFLQNMWVRDPERVKQMLADGVARFGPKYRHRLTATLLFAGCLTGRRLRKELGDLCDEIVWEEASPEVLGNPRDVPKADMDHIVKVLSDERPALVLAFGKVADDALRSLPRVTLNRSLPSITIIPSPHPAARSVECQAAFKAAMARVRELATQEVAA